MKPSRARPFLRNDFGLGAHFEWLADIGGAGIELAAGGVPADTVAGASGDWHDVIPVRNGSSVIVVGDAVGRGAAALPIRGEVQPALRRVANAGASPSEIISHLRDALTLGDDTLVTVTVVALAPDGGSLRIASAGHPPPLLMSNGHVARFLNGGVSPPLGVAWAGRQPVTSAALPAGSILILYTDGLVDRQDSDLDCGFALLAAGALEGFGDPLVELCARILDLGIVDGKPVDDLTAVALRRRPSGPMR